MKEKNVVIQQQEEIPTEIIAKSIIAISEGVSKLLTGSRLKERGLLLLIQDNIPTKDRVSIKEIKTILDSIGSLRRSYIKSE